jgi:hypothetical protein
MTHASTLVASAAVIALTLGITSRADTPSEKADPLSPHYIIIAAADTAPAAGQTEENAEENAQDSAKMGEEEGTHEGANLGATPENDTSKIDQAARRNPITGNTTGDYNGAPQ